MAGGLPHVLLVEDDDDLRDAILESLSAVRRFSLTPASTARQAIAAVTRKPADVLILDANLPDLPLPPLVAELRRVQGEPAAAMVLLTGGHGIQATARKLGTRFFLRKPASADHLFRTVCAALEDRTARLGRVPPLR